MSEDNPYLNQTSFISRPTGTEPAYRYQTIASLTRDQRFWDVAKAAERAANTSTDVAGPGINHSIVPSSRIESIAPSVERSRPWNSSLLPPLPRRSPWQSSRPWLNQSRRRSTGGQNGSSHS